jgi:hypothetical protein
MRLSNGKRIPEQLEQVDEHANKLGFFSKDEKASGRAAHEYFPQEI